jgi:hypothetical protein
MEKELRDLINKIAGVTEVEVGKFDLALGDKVQAVEAAHNAMHEELNDKAKAYYEQEEKEMHARVEAYVMQLEKEHQPACKVQKAELKAAWNAVYDAVGVPVDERELPYRINRKKGTLTRIDKVAKEPVQ